MFIEYHFRQTLYRLVHSLELFQQHTRSWSNFLESGGLAGPNPALTFTIPMEAGIAADSLFHYLNLFIDDIARVIPFVLFKTPSDAQVDGLSTLKKKILTNKISVSSRLRELFEELDQETSWYHAGFQRGKGIRQRLVHYTDIIFFSGGPGKDHDKMVPEISLAAVGEKIVVGNFEESLRKLLGGLCEWLDQIEEVLIEQLSKRMAEEKIAWSWMSAEYPAVSLAAISNPEGDVLKREKQRWADLYLPQLV